MTESRRLLLAALSPDKHGSEEPWRSPTQIRVSPRHGAEVPANTSHASAHVVGTAQTLRDARTAQTLHDAGTAQTSRNARTAQTSCDMRTAQTPRDARTEHSPETPANRQEIGSDDYNMVAAMIETEEDEESMFLSMYPAWEDSDEVQADNHTEEGPLCISCACQ